MSEETGKRNPDAKASTGPPDAHPPVRKGIGGILAGLGLNLGFGRSEVPDPSAGVKDVSTRLAYQRTDLAVERSYMASERTLMGWIRTALSMISFGFTIGKIGQAVTDVQMRGFLRHTVGVKGVAYFLVVLGTLGLAGAILQHLVRTYELRVQGLKRRVSLVVIISLLLFLVGAFALTALILEL